MNTKNESSVQKNIRFDNQHIWHPYGSIINQPKNYYVESCEGSKIILKDGKVLIDGMSSWWCAIHGYNNPELNEAIEVQLNKMSHVMFGGLTHQPAIDLGRKLINLTEKKLDCLFFADTGSVAIDVALKMAIQCFQGLQKNSKKKFLAMSLGYHGDTFGAMSVCDPLNPMHSMFEKVLQENAFISLPNIGFFDEWNETCMRPLEDYIKNHHKELAGIILEPIVQGAGGFQIYHPNILKEIRVLCTRFNILLILDEIATGFGRTGKLFAYQYANIVPDILCLGKALTGGYMTLSCTMCTRTVTNAICNGKAKCFMHGPTFMGNPLACAVANKSIEILQRGDWRKQVMNIQKIIMQEWKMTEKGSIIKDIRVLGAIGIIELNIRADIEWFQKKFVEKGVWVRPLSKFVYITPQYGISEKDLRILCRVVIDVIYEFANIRMGK